ncbi:hypothetical protein C0J52_22591, partial [Blattella germanica]
FETKRVSIYLNFNFLIITQHTALFVPCTHSLCSIFIFLNILITFFMIFLKSCKL